MYGVKVIAGILVTAAVIAFVGDWVGRRLGKLRLRLFGLRPRHTAMVMTVITGMLIAGFTLLVVVALSEYAKAGLLQVADLMRQQAELRQANRRLRLERERLRLAVEEARGRERRARLRAISAERRIREARRELARVREALRRVDLQRRRLQADLKRSLRELGRLIKVRKATEEELREALERIRALHGRISLLEEERERLEDERERLTGEIAKLSREVGRLSEEARRLGELVKQARAVLSEVRERPITFRAGEALSMAVFEAGVSPEDALPDLLDMLDRANTEAIRRGAAVDEEGWALLFASPKEERIVPPEEAARVVASRLAQFQRPMVVRLVALTNCVEGERVYVGFRLIPNRLIFKEGETVAEMEVDGRRPPEEIFERLIGLLKIHARAEAERRGLLPHPAGSPGEEPFFGRASYREVFRAVEAIRKAQGIVKVKAVAISDTYTIGPLEVRFVVEPVSR